MSCFAILEFQVKIQNSGNSHAGQVKQNPILVASSGLRNTSFDVFWYAAWETLWSIE